MFSHAATTTDAAGDTRPLDLSREHRPDRQLDAPPPCTQCVITLAGSSVGFLDGPAKLARFSGPRAVAIGAAGAVFVADTGNHRIRSIAEGRVASLAGDGEAGYLDGAASAARFSSPEGVATRGALVVVADTGNRRIRAIEGGEVTTLAGSGEEGISDGPVYVAKFSAPAAVAIDGWGTIFVADRGSGRIRTIAGGAVATLTSGLASPTGVAVDSVGTVYVAESGGHLIRLVQAKKLRTLAGSKSGFTEGDAAQARFAEPSGVVALPGGAVLVADRKNHRVRRIADGLVATLAGSGAPGELDDALLLASFREPVGLALDLSGRVYVADLGNQRVRVIIRDR